MDRALIMNAYSKGFAHRAPAPAPTSRRFATLAGVALAVGLATALAVAPHATVASDKVYSWVDENGVRHFGDLPPDRDDAQVMEVEGVPRISGGSSAESIETSAPEASSRDAGAGAADEALTAAQLKRQELAENRAQRRAEQAETQRVCDQSRAQLQQIEPHRRVYFTNDSGETERMDDVERVNAVARLKEFIEANCQ
jgi:hypothetical protein